MHNLQGHYLQEQTFFTHSPSFSSAVKLQLQNFLTIYGHQNLELILQQLQKNSNKWYNLTGKRKQSKRKGTKTGKNHNLDNNVS